MGSRTLRQMTQAFLVAVIVALLPSPANSEDLLKQLYQSMASTIEADYVNEKKLYAEVSEDNENAEKALVAAELLLKQKLYQVLINSLVCWEAHYLPHVEAGFPSDVEQSFNTCYDERYNAWKEYIYYAMVNANSLQGLESLREFDRCSRRHTLYTYMLRFPPYEFLKREHMRAYDTVPFLECIKNIP